jgi:cytochrome c
MAAGDSLLAGEIVAEHKAPVTGVAFSPDGRTLYTASYDGEARATRIGTPQESGRRTPAYRVGLPGSINGMAMLADGRLVLGGADGRVRVLAADLAPGFEVELKDGPLTAIAVAPDGRTIAVGGMRTPVTLIDAGAGKPHRQIMGPGLPIWALAFSADGRELLTGGADGAFRRWSVPGGEALGAISTPAGDPGAKAANDDGARVFRACAACHTTRSGEGHRAGPTLHGVFGRRIATAPGYQYSEALKGLEIVWTRDTIARLFEVGPSVFTPGTKMPEQRITDPADRQALLEWLERETRP